MAVSQCLNLTGYDSLDRKQRTRRLARRNPPIRCNVRSGTSRRVDLPDECLLFGMTGPSAIEADVSYPPRTDVGRQALGKDNKKGALRQFPGSNTAIIRSVADRVHRFPCF